MLFTTVPASPTQPAQKQSPSVACIRAKDWAGEHKAIDLLDKDNWQFWHDNIDLTFNICGLCGYIDDTLPCPNVATEPIATGNWTYNNDYTKKVIRDRISRGQKYHVTNCRTSQEMWVNLKAIHQSCSDQTENQLMHKLTDKKAHDGNDIIQHLASIKQTWDHITLVCQGNLPLSPKLFKKFLAYSLPPTWNKFMRQFSHDPAKKDLSVSQFIGECHEEYWRRVQRGNRSTDSTYSAYGKPLANHIGRVAQDQEQKTLKLKCMHCGHTNHKFENYYHALKPKCTICKKLGHNGDHCQKNKDKLKKKKSSFQTNKDKRVINTLTTKEETQLAEVNEDDEDETLTAMEIEKSSLSDCVSLYDCNDLASLTSNEVSHMYDWLADSESTNHITNWHEFFSSYEPTPGATIQGVEGKIIQIEGHGTIKLTAKYGTCEWILHLENVSYIPSNKYNIFALGRWDSQGQRYQVSNGELILFNRQNVPVLKGQKVTSHI